MDSVDKYAKILNTIDGVCYTADLDWASEYVVEEILSFFSDEGIHPTVFITHPSKCASQYAEEGKADLGVHPNFIQPSSHGKDMREVLDYCTGLLPSANMFRCHRWFASNDIYDEFYRRGFVLDSNICTMLEAVNPFRHRSGIMSFPVFLEDGAWLYHNLPIDFHAYSDVFTKRGLKIINIHPMHFALNTPYFKYMRDIKDRLPRERWNNLDADAVSSLKNKNSPGIADFIRDMVRYYKKIRCNQYTLKEAYEIITGATRNGGVAL